MDWTKPANDKTIDETAKALESNGFKVFVVNSGEEAKRKALEIIPKGSEVLTSTSVTTQSIGLAEEINNSGNYNSVINRLRAMDREKQHLEMNKIGSAPEWIVGSIHALTMDGKAIIASASGSQLPGYSYGSVHVLWIVGSQKIVKDLDEGMRRIYEHSLPLESERARKAYGVSGSAVFKLLIMQKEKPGRITIILVREALGF